MKKHLSIPALLLGIALALSLLGGCNTGTPGAAGSEGKTILDSSEKVVWRLGHSAYEGDLIYTYAETVKTELESAFEGKVEVQLFPAGQLGDYVAQQELLQSGGLEFNIPVTNSLSSIVPEACLTSINFILHENVAVNDKAMNEGKAFAYITEKLVEKNIQPLTWISEDFSCWSSNTPIQKVENLKGLKIRVYPSSQIIANYEVLGANPTAIPFAEVYSALQLNSVTAQENPIVVIYSNKFYEVQKYVTISNHTASVNALATGVGFWNTLAPEDQERIQTALDKAYELTASARDAYTQDAIAKITDSGKTTFLELDPAERQRMVEQSVPAREEYLNIAGENGQMVLDLWLADLETFKDAA